MRTMADSVNAAALPADLPLYAGYVNGTYVNCHTIRARFPHATVVPITVNPHEDVGTVYDCEPGNGTPTDVPGWVTMRRKAGVTPTVYTTLAWHTTAMDACLGAGVNQPYWWLADPTHRLDRPSGRIVALQRTYPGPYDLSAVANYWPGVDNPARDPRIGDTTMTVFTTPAGAAYVVVAGRAIPLHSGDEVKAYTDAGATHVALPSAQALNAVVTALA